LEQVRTEKKKQKVTFCKKGKFGNIGKHWKKRVLSVAKTKPEKTSE
jgi:hypothetical protein